jgi:hypothetical protein
MRVTAQFPQKMLLFHELECLAIVVAQSLLFFTPELFLEA